MSQAPSALAEPDVTSYRLPKTVIPTRYEIKLSPDLTTFSFDGEEIITIEVKKATQEILLNSLELEILSAQIKCQDNVISAAIEIIEEDQRLKLTFSQTLEPGKYSLNIKFKGKINDKLHGFYRSSYKDSEGTTKVLAVTQFEATDARRAFPCWDEPDFKAVFQTTLVIDKALTAISNTDIETEQFLDNGKKELRFKDTIKMSTYIMAFVIGEFEATEPVLANTTPIRIFSVPGKGHLTEFAKGIAKYSIEHFESYFGVPYMGGKMDLIAIPDFAFGAMENIGCVTFRETALLVDKKTASHAEMERVADVVAHEIAHMWFGNLTTMSWWNGIWLNEAFATFAEMMAVAAWRPEWRRWESFAASRSAAFNTDGLRSTRTIEYPVHKPEDCEGMFDVLTYEKGASVLRMLEQFITEEKFRKGMNLYLDNHKFANTETSDLWNALENASGQPVRKIMDSWIFQPGFPVITIQLINDNKAIKLEQRRFLYLPEVESSPQIFHIPLILRIQYKDGKKETRKIIFDSTTTTITFDREAECVIGNAEGHGFYRILYPASMLDYLSKNANKFLEPIERFNLVSDTWALTLAGQASVESYLNMLKAFHGETDKNVWSTVIGSLSYLDRIIDNASDREKLQIFTRHLLSDLHHRLGWKPQDKEDDLTKQLRGSAIAALGTIGNDPDIISQATTAYAKFQTDPSTIDPNVIPAVVRIVAANGDQACYKQFLDLRKEAKTPQEEQRYLFALSEFSDLSLLTETLSLTITDEVRTQDAPYLLRNLMMNRYCRQEAWQFLKDNWKIILERYPANSIARMMEGITGLVSAELETDVNQFLQENPPKHGGKLIDQHLEKLRIAVQFQQYTRNKLN